MIKSIKLKNAFIGCLDHENIHLDPKIMPLSSLEPKIFVVRYLEGGHFVFCNFEHEGFICQLGKQFFRIQHTQITLKNLFTNFSPQMPTTFWICEKQPSLYYNLLDNGLCWFEIRFNDDLRFSVFYMLVYIHVKNIIRVMLMKIEPISKATIFSSQIASLKCFKVAIKTLLENMSATDIDILRVWYKCLL